MTVTVETVPAAGAGQLIGALRRWAPQGCYVTGLHAGDVGWQLRMSDVVDDSLVAVRDGGDLVAVALKDSPTALRPLVRPDRYFDASVAAALVECVEGMPRDAEAYTDAGSGSAYRSLLSAAGWQLDPDPWVVLYRPLSAVDGEFKDALCRPLETEQDIADRVAVQRAAFDRSTFTVPRWHQMAAGPGFDPAFEYLRRTVDGAAVAAATGWSAGQGKCGILEPVGTHRDYAGAGHGKAVSMAVIAALARGGASGVTVQTPASNEAAVRTYESCGLRQVEITRGLMRPAVT